jgi:hypothetical protein
VRTTRSLASPTGEVRESLFSTRGDGLSAVRHLRFGWRTHTEWHSGQMADRRLIRNRPGLGRGRAPEGRRVLDLAEGILIGLRRYSAEAAFDELVTVARRHEITMSAAASALVDLATGNAATDDDHPVEKAIAQHQWGDLFRGVEASNGRA